MRTVKYVLPVILLLIFGTAAGIQDLRIDLENQEAAKRLTPLEVMTCNIGDLGMYKILSKEEVVDFFKLCGVPDILLLQEVRMESEAGYISDKLGLTHFVFLNDFQGKHGMAILSRFPFSNPDHIYFKTSKYGYGAVAVDAKVGDKTIQLVSVHMDRIDSVTMKDKKIAVNLGFLWEFAKNEFLEDSVRSQSAEQLIQWIDGKKAANVVIGGDFNSVPFSKTIRTMESRFDDAMWPSLQYLTGTYRRVDFPVAPKVDYLFLSPNLYRRDSAVVPLSPGDHFPVKTHIRL